MNRYSRQTIFGGIGAAGQQRLHAATVAVVGLGATGSALFNTLLRSGVGHLHIIDRDWVEEHNLPRQTLYTEADAQALAPKAIAAAAHGRAINSAASITPFVLDINPDTIDAALGGANLILDGADNLELRYLINDWCVRERRPWIYTGVLAGHGMTATLQPDGPCLRCIFPHIPAPGSSPTCETAGVVGPAVGVLASLAAAEALKLLTGSGTLNPGLLAVDVWSWTFDQLPVPLRRADCPACGRGDYQFLDSAANRTASLCGRDAVQVRPAVRTSLDLAALARRLAEAGLAVQHTDYLLRCAAESYRLTVFPDGRAIIAGTDDQSIARGVYARWIGN
jgi:adenylyltransferase/sulfurtransferase